ncbi:asparagine synthase-related protein [Brevundimonas sp.]|uniref:asparagine synthase-related protein n=1 Tax=Brevundimonas sp. TaxID=1871086 RepID=UPI0019B0AC97|nr:asparagine synthase-related protein [Brevundimonas sp.]MBD3836811.1 asparagine synthase [Brevundimonas sp.]
MLRFALISARVDASDGAGTLRRFRTRAVEHGYVLSLLDKGLWLAADPAAAPAVARFGDWLVLGDAFPHPDRRPASPPRMADDVVDNLWGRYLAVRCDAAGRPAAVVRDASGAVDGWVWRGSGAVVIASVASLWMLDATRPTLAIDAAAVHAVLHAPSRAWDLGLLSGLCSVAPGAVLDLDRPWTSRPVWRPSRFVDRARGLSVDAAGDLLRRRVDQATTALSADARGLAVELSGGLDSSIVATSVRRTGRPVIAWLHTYGADPEADERVFARGLAERMGVALACLPRPDAALTTRDLETLSTEARPGFNGMDPLNDAAAAACLSQDGAEVLLTGKGGDAVFLQAFGAAVFEDLRRRRGPAALLSPTLTAAARWEGRSVWSILSGGVREPAAPRPPGLLTPLETPVPPHPWLADLPRLGPARRFQIEGLIDGPGFSTASRQTAVADLRHPLLAQPVVEACLSIPSPRLTLCRDRGLARRAFADRLTPDIAARRSKGDLTAYYGRMIARSLPALRPWLLDGALCAQGLLDRGRTEQALTTGQLIWRGGYREIMIAATMESWQRTWSSRIERLRAAR